MANLPHRVDRRDFLKQSSLAALAFWAGTRSAKAQADKLNIGIIGAGGRGAGNIDGVASENIVAICDVDDNMAAGARQRFPDARYDRDYRKLIEETPNLEALVISTADHTHGLAAAMGLARGLHIYCEKPLVRTIAEVRRLRELNEQAGTATQMGNGGSAAAGQRRTTERVWSGVLGPIREVHCWTDRPAGWWPQGVDRPANAEPVPEHLDWDLWLGPSPERPYHSIYHPFRWRGWWDFGTGALGDMGCHILNMAYRGLELGMPVAVTAINADHHPETGPTASTVLYEFPARQTARGELPPVQLFWHDGGRKPSRDLVEGRELAAGGTILIGDNGVLLGTDENSSGHVLLPEAKFADVGEPPRVLPRSPGHHAEWIIAAKGGDPPPLSQFSYATDLTEAVLLGALAQQLPEQRIEWDAAAMRSPNTPEAEVIVSPPRRRGWEMP